MKFSNRMMISSFSALSRLFAQGFTHSNQQQHAHGMQALCRASGRRQLRKGLSTSIRCNSLYSKTEFRFTPGWDEYGQQAIQYNHANSDDNSSSRVPASKLRAYPSSRSRSFSKMSVPQPLTRTEVRRMKVAELRQELAARNLDTNGLRKDLLDRLLGDITASASASASAPVPNNAQKSIKKDPEKSHSSKQNSMTTATATPARIRLSPDKLYVLRFHGRYHHLSAAASCGLVLYDTSNERKIWSGSQYYPSAAIESVQQAEMRALHSALLSMSKLGLRKVIVQGHAKGTVINQLQGNFGINSQNMKILHKKLKKIFYGMEEAEVWGVPGDQIGRAKNLAKKAMEYKFSEGFELLNISDVDTAEVSFQREDNDDDGVENDEHKTLPYLPDEPFPGDMNMNMDETYEQTQGQHKSSETLVSLPSFSPNKIYVLRFDGGSRGNPGISGCGMVLFDSESGLEVWSAFQYLGDDSTNNIAEYSALLFGLQFASAMGITRVVAEGDSKLVVKQVTGEYAVKSAHLKLLNEDVKALAETFDSFSIHYIPRAENFRADQLANFAMDEGYSMGLEVLDYLKQSQSDDGGVNMMQEKSPEWERTDTASRVYVPSSVQNTGTPTAKVGLNIPDVESSDRQLSPSRTYILRFGGGAKGQQGAGSAAILMDDISGAEIWSGSHFIDDKDTSQFIAGYIALIIGIRKAMSMGVTRLIIQGNMEFIVHQMTGNWKVKSEAIKPYYMYAKDLCKNHFEDVDFELITGEENADVKGLFSDAIMNRRSRLPGFS